MFERAVVDLATAVVDGDSIDWPSARARFTSPDDREIVCGLETVSHFRQQGLATEHQRRPALPLLLEATRLVAILCSVVGLAGFVPLLKGPQPFRYAILLAIFLAFGVTGAYLDLGGQDRRSRALAACNWTSAASFGARGVFQLTRLWPNVRSLQAILVLRPEALFAAALWQFARDFPAVTRFSPIDRVCRPGLNLALMVGSALFAVNVVPFAMPASRIAAVVAPFQRLTGDGPLFWSLVFGVAIPALLVMGWRARSSDERSRVRFFLYSVAGGFAPMMIEVFLEGLFPAYARLMRTARGTFWASLVVYPPLFLVPIATAYAVTAENVLEVRVVVQRGLRYLLARWLLTWLAAIPVLLLLATVYRHADEPLNVTLSKAPGTILFWCAGVGAMVLASRRTLVALLDRWALPGKRSSSSMLAHMSDRLKQARTPLEVASILAEAAERALQTRASTYLYVAGEVVATTDALVPPRSSLLGVLLGGSRDPCVVGPNSAKTYFSLLSDTDRRWIREEQLQVIVPVVSNRNAEDGLLAFVALRSRKNALAFSEDDLRFLRVGAGAASLACEAIASQSVSRTDAAAVEEVGSECSACGRVDRWNSETRTCSCGGRLQPAILPKEVLARFHIDRRLGAGGMGIVYHAVDVTLGRDVAVKTLTSLSDDAVTRIMAEARVMANLAHSDVAVLYSVERWRGTPLLIMEYLSGGTLAARLRREGPLSVEEAIRITRVLALALDRLHEASLYHGDIKPSNIGFTADGTPKLLDFGLARAVYESATANTPLTGGTLAYLSPEVRDGGLPGTRLDLWALGMVLSEMLLGTHPCPAARSEGEIARGIQIAVARLRPSITPPLDALLRSALSLSPDDRPSSAAALDAALAAIARSTQPS